MAHYADIECPECSAAISIKVSRSEYGEDYDGHRGEWRYEAEITGRDCKCELTSHQEEFVENAAIEEAQ